MSVEAELRAAEERIFAAIQRRDVDALGAELCEDFRHSTPGGAEQDRAAFLQAVRDMPYRILRIEGEAIKVRVLGETALLFGVQRARVALPEGGEVTSLTGFVDAFACSDGTWRLRHAVSFELPSPA
jgi:ketosteroid isomerase-like protein